MQGPFPDIKASNSWHKESWLPLGGAAGFLAVVAGQRSNGVGLGVGWGHGRDLAGHGDFRRGGRGVWLRRD